MKRFSWITAVLLVVGCGGNPIGVQFDASVPGNLQSLMQSDLDRLSTLQLPPADPTILSYMRLPDTSPASLTAWLQTRMHYVVGESYVYSDHDQPIPVSSTLANTVDPAQLGESQTVMLNLGSFRYLSAKGTHQEDVLSLCSSIIQIFSPRVGIFQIGNGLTDANAIKGVDLGATSNSILRLATYIHEGGHDDGNLANTGFPHAKCNSGDYAKQYACENNLNGPYAIQTYFLQLASQACIGCTSTETTGLQLATADYASRLIDYQLPDPTPESLQGVGAGFGLASVVGRGQ